MEEFAEYILNEKDLIAKEEIIYFLASKLGIKFDKSIVFKTEIARMFLEYTNIKLDHNLILTACLLCNCKKVDNSQKLGKVQTYAIEGARHLAKLGFDARFCKICEGVNRYSEQDKREPESDILELVDQFGGMLIDRPERVGLHPDEAMVLIEHRNLKGEYNRYLEIFRDFALIFDKVYIHGVVNTTVFARLQKLIRESKDVPEFVKKLSIDYSVTVDEKIKEVLKNNETNLDNKSMFSNETKEKILKKVNDGIGG